MEVMKSVMMKMVKLLNQVQIKKGAMRYCSVETALCESATTSPHVASSGKCGAVNDCMWPLGPTRLKYVFVVGSVVC